MSAEPNRLELLQRTIDATDEHQATCAQLFTASVERDALLRGMLQLKLECANEEYAHGEIPVRVVLALIDEAVKATCEQKRAAGRVVHAATTKAVIL